MGTTYLKRQKEMKRLEKQREKAERRAQKKLAKGAQSTQLGEEMGLTESEAAGLGLAEPGAQNGGPDQPENSSDPDQNPLK